MNLSQMKSEKEIKKICGEAVAEQVNARKLADVIEKSREVFYENQTRLATSRLEFLYQQSRYIKKSWWLAQAGLLLFLWLAIWSINSGAYLQKCMGLAAPIFVVLVMPEFWKNRSAGAMELECSTYYSLRQIYAARLICFALVDLALLSVFFVAVFTVTDVAAKIPIVDLIVQFFVPFNITCCICFGCLYSRRKISGSLTWLMCMVWMVLWVQIVMNGELYERIAAPVWVALLVLSTVYLAYSIARGQRRCEHLWEVKPIWNLK